MLSVDEPGLDNYEGSLDQPRAQAAAQNATRSLPGAVYGALACAALAVGLSRNARLGKALVACAPACLIIGVCELMKFPSDPHRSCASNRGYSG